MRFFDRLRYMLSGRYGRDPLNYFLYIVCLILIVASIVLRIIGFRFNFLYFLALIVLAVIYYRTLSRNYEKRAAENRKFLEIKEAFFGNHSRRKQQKQDKDHAYFKCPRCKKTLRVPKGKGRISIHCPQCGTDFIKTT